jgi:hypothetical protein
MSNPTPTGRPTMTVATHRPSRAGSGEEPAPRTPAAHAALADLLHAAQDAEATASGPDRRIAFRHTRSLIGAARRLGFTYPALADMLGTSESAARSRTDRPWPIQPSAFRALIPPERLPTTGVLFADFDAEHTVDLVAMLDQYLSTFDTQA